MIYIIYIIYMHAYFISNISVSNARLKLAKNSAKAKQHPEAEFSLFENYSLFSFTLSSKQNLATFEAQFIKKLSKTKAELKKALLIKKKRVYIYILK